MRMPDMHKKLRLFQSIHVEDIKLIGQTVQNYQMQVVQKYGSGFPHVKDTKKSDQMDDPLVHLEKNLFGHPLAGLLWPTKLQDGLFKNGLEKVPT